MQRGNLVVIENLQLSNLFIAPLPITDMKLQEVIEKRRSIRKFKDKRVKISDIYEAIDAALHAPRAGNIENLYIIIVTKQEIKSRLSQYADQDWMADADIVLVVCSDNRPLERMYHDRAEKYARHQAGAAIQNILLELEELKLSGCWIGAFLDTGVKKTLKIPEHINVEALIPIGYPAEKPKAPKTASLENTTFWEEWNQRKKPALTKDPATR